eukprot:428050-Hanusia_phi.AAC.1
MCQERSAGSERRGSGQDYQPLSSNCRWSSRDSRGGGGRDEIRGGKRQKPAAGIISRIHVPEGDTIRYLFALFSSEQCSIVP